MIEKYYRTDDIFKNKLPIIRLGAAFQNKHLKFISSCIHAHMENF